MIRAKGSGKGIKGKSCVTAQTIRPSTIRTTMIPIKVPTMIHAPLLGSAVERTSDRSFCLSLLELFLALLDALRGGDIGMPCDPQSVRDTFGGAYVVLEPHAEQQQYLRVIGVL